MTKGELRSAREALERTRQPYAVATVVWRREPTSAHVGDQALVASDGHVFGWIGGACAEPALIAEALRAIREDRPRVVCLGAKSDFGPGDASRSVLESGCLGEGALEIYVEPQREPARLWIVGETPVASALGDIAERVGFSAQRFLRAPGGCCGGAVQPPAAPEIARDDFGVVASFGAADAEACAWLLASPASYVALVASRRRGDAVRAALRTSGLAEYDVARLRSPAGLDLGPIRHSEIAVAVLAEIIALRAEQARSSAEHADAAHSAEAEAEVTDPVCGMTFARVRARERLEVGSAVVYFCGSHCRERYQP